jgi:hypothetical protein
MQVQSSTINLSSQHMMRRSEQQRSISIEQNSQQPPTVSRQPTDGQVNLGQSSTAQSPPRQSIDLKNIARQVIVPPPFSTFGSRENSRFTTPDRNTTAGISEKNRPTLYSSNSLSNDTQYIGVSSSLDSHQMLRKALIEYLSGITFNTVRIDTNSKSQSGAMNHPSFSKPHADNRLESQQFFTFNGTLISEYELTSVTIGAELVDDRGTQIDISLSVTMERHYQETEADLRIRANGRLQDPLVINFNGEAVVLSNQKISFDINSDGINDQIPTFRSNSAYIALDKNNDGLINNGSELFGTQSGNGFIDLAGYDEDGNGFIDEADTVYAQLQAFDPGTGSLRPLHLIGVGALALSSTYSPFSLTDDNNNKLGQVRSTGFYVNDDGSAGTLQQIDLVV